MPCVTTTSSVRACDRAAAAALILFDHDAVQHAELIARLLQRINCPLLHSFICLSYVDNSAPVYPLEAVLRLMNKVVRCPDSMVRMLQLLVAAGMTPANVDDAVLSLVSVS